MMDEKTATNKYPAKEHASREHAADAKTGDPALTVTVGDFRVELVRDMQTYEGLKSLWCRVFGDEPEYVDHMYQAFSAGTFLPAGSCIDDSDDIANDRTDIHDCDIEGYVIKDKAGKVVSALTCYLCGTYLCRPVYVSYAICTDPAYRGLGLAGRSTSFVREIVVKEKGGISIVSPASESLIRFYEGLGYETHFFAETVVAYAEDEEDPAGNGEMIQPYDFLGNNKENESKGTFENEGAKIQELFADEDFVEFEPELNLTPLSVREYNEYRESFLTDTPHIRLSEKMLEFIRTDSKDSDGLYLINHGDAICVISGTDSDQKETLILSELLVNPLLKSYSAEIDSEIASQLASELDTERVVYRRPGPGSCQSMISKGSMKDCIGKSVEACAGNAMTEGEPADQSSESAYYGFPID